MDRSLASVLADSLAQTQIDDSVREQQAADLAMAISASEADHRQTTLSTRPPLIRRPEGSSALVQQQADHRIYLGLVPESDSIVSPTQSHLMAFTSTMVGSGSAIATEPLTTAGGALGLIRLDSCNLTEGHYLRGSTCSDQVSKAAKERLCMHESAFLACGSTPDSIFRDLSFPPTAQSLGTLSRQSTEVRVLYPDGTSRIRERDIGWESPSSLYPQLEDRTDREAADEVRRIAIESIASGERAGGLAIHRDSIRKRIGRGIPLEGGDFEVFAAAGANMFQLRRSHARPSARDVRQAGLGTCWFVSAMAVASEGPGTLEHILLQSKLPRHGMLQLQLCLGGEWRVVTIDDKLPVDRRTGALVFTSGRLGQLWPSYIEKALAKLSGSFAGAVGGGVGEGLALLTGAPIDRVCTSSCLTDHERRVASMAKHAAKCEGGRGWLPRWLAEACDNVDRAGEEGELWARLLSWDESGFLVGASCGRIGDDGTPELELEASYKLRGLVYNHAYSVLKLIEVPLPVLDERFRRSYAACPGGESAGEEVAPGAAAGGSTPSQQRTGGAMEIERVIVLRNPWSDLNEVGWNGRYGRKWPGMTADVRAVVFAGLWEDDAAAGMSFPESSRRLISGLAPPGVFAMAFDDFRRYFGTVDAACVAPGIEHARHTAAPLPRSMALGPANYPVFVVADVHGSMHATACVHQLPERLRVGMQVRMAIAQSLGGSDSAVSTGLASEIAAEYGWNASESKDVGGIADLGCVVVRVGGGGEPGALVANDALRGPDWQTAKDQLPLPTNKGLGISEACIGAIGAEWESAWPQVLRAGPRSISADSKLDFFLDARETHVIIPLSFGPMLHSQLQQLTVSLHGRQGVRLEQQFIGGEALAQVLCARARCIGKAMPLTRVQEHSGSCMWTVGGDSGDILVVENKHPSSWLELKLDYSERCSNVRFSRGSPGTQDMIPPSCRQVV